MGSFSWNRADVVKVGEPENIYKGYRFKCLIPKEFGGGFLEDTYRDYGDVVYKGKKYDLLEVLAFWNREQVKPRSTSGRCIPMDLSVGAKVTIMDCAHFISRVYDEVLDFCGMEFEIKEVFRSGKDGEVMYSLVGANGILFTRTMFVDTSKYVPDAPQGLLWDGFIQDVQWVSKYTVHNRILGSRLCYPEKDNHTRQEHIECVDALKYPLKLVSASYEGTYEDCEGNSYSDPDQGFFPRIKRG